MLAGFVSRDVYEIGWEIPDGGGQEATARLKARLRADYAIGPKGGQTKKGAHPILRGVRSGKGRTVISFPPLCPTLTVWARFSIGQIGPRWAGGEIPDGEGLAQITDPSALR